MPRVLKRLKEIMDLASNLNHKPLLPIPVVAFPPVEELLTFWMFDTVNGARVVQKMMKGVSNL